MFDFLYYSSIDASIRLYLNLLVLENVDLDLEMPLVSREHPHQYKKKIQNIKFDSQVQKIPNLAYQIYQTLQIY